MIDILIGFIVGALTGYCASPKDKDLQEQQDIYNKKVIQYEIDIAYYKQLCKWHVERNSGKASE